MTVKEKTTNSIVPMNYVVKWLDEPDRVNVKKVIYNDPATIVYFSDGSKSVVKRHPDDEYDEEKGFLLCLAKRLLGDDFHNSLKKYTTLYK